MLRHSNHLSDESLFRNIFDIVVLLNVIAILGLICLTGSKRETMVCMEPKSHHYLIAIILITFYYPFRNKRFFGCDIRLFLLVGV